MRLPAKTYLILCDKPEGLGKKIRTENLYRSALTTTRNIPRVTINQAMGWSDENVPNATRKNVSKIGSCRVQQSEDIGNRLDVIARLFPLLRNFGNMVLEGHTIGFETQRHGGHRVWSRSFLSALRASVLKNW